MRIHSIDFLRVVAIFSVIVLHSSPFHGYSGSVFRLLDVLINQSTRFALPCFFIVSGYFFGKKIRLEPKQQVDKIFFIYTRRLLPLFFVWSLIYILLPTDIKKEVLQNGLLEAMFQKFDRFLSNPTILLLYGGRGHLWYIASLLLSLGIISLFAKLKIHSWILPFSISLYLFGLSAGTYSSTPLGIETCISSRIIHNGPLFSTLFVAIGWGLSFTKYVPNLLHSLIFIVSGIMIHFFEVFTLCDYYNVSPFENGYFLGIAVWSTGIVLFALSRPLLFKDNFITRWAPYTLGIYLIHMLILDILTPFDRYIPTPYWDIIYPILTFIISLLVVYTLKRNNLSRFIVAY